MPIVLNIMIALLTLAWSAIPMAAGQTQTDLAFLVQKEAEKGGYRLIDVGELRELYQDTSRNVLLIDTRQDWEYRTGHITDAIHFPMEPNWFSRLIQRHALAQKLGPDKDRILIFY